MHIDRTPEPDYYQLFRTCWRAAVRYNVVITLSTKHDVATALCPYARPCLCSGGTHHFIPSRLLVEQVGHTMCQPFIAEPSSTNLVKVADRRFVCASGDEALRSRTR